MAQDKTSTKRRTLLIISHDKIGASMAGPGIRYHYMAEELSDVFDVTVGFFDASYLPGKDFITSYKTKHIDAYHYEPGFTGTDIVIALWLSDSMMNYCNENNIFVVFDMYAPVPVENLASTLYSGKKILQETDYEYQQSLSMYRKFFDNGDLFLPSNRRQLDFWTGYVFGADSVRLSTYHKRPFFDRFIMAPMGIDTRTPLVHTKQVIKGVIPGISENDKVLLWTGGIWGWYDGQVLVRTMKALLKKRPDIKLVFFGTKHPNPSIPEMKESLDTRQLAKKLGVLNKNVFFLDGWVPYHERINYLLEGDVAINTHKISIETEFSHRTRVLDHILAELPTISTVGDFLSDDVIDRNDLGIAVPADDEVALEAAIVDILKPARYREIKQNLRAVRQTYDWRETLKPLKEYLLTDPEPLPLLRKLSVRRTHKGFLGFLRRITPGFIKKLILRAIN